jgi:hypothetical protein
MINFAETRARLVEALRQELLPDLKEQAGFDDNSSH